MSHAAYRYVIDTLTEVAVIFCNLGPAAGPWFLNKIAASQARTRDVSSGFVQLNRYPTMSPQEAMLGVPVFLARGRNTLLSQEAAHWYQRSSRKRQRRATLREGSAGFCG